jgi:hypothetical protein
MAPRAQISSLTLSGLTMSIHSRFNSTALAMALAVATAASGSLAYAADMPIKAAPVATPFFLVNDNSVSFTYFPGSTDPGIYGASYNQRYQWDLTHFDVNRWGTNFIDFNFQQYGKKDPVQSIYGAQGSEEADALVRNTLSGNAFLGKGFFSNYITKDISLAYGGLFVVVDNFLAPQTHQYDIGAQFTLNLPGTVNLAVYAQKETHHVSQDAVCNPGSGAFGGTFYNPPVNGYPGTTMTACPFTGDQTFKWAPRLELVALEPLTFLPTWLPMSWNSFTGVTFPKGTGLSQSNVAAMEISATPTGPAGWCFQGGNNPSNQCSTETKTEIFSENRLVLDVGKMYWGKAGLLEGFVGYRFWYNKFGTDHNAGVFSVLAPNTSIESTAFFGTTYHFTN